MPIPYMVKANHSAGQNFFVTSELADPIALVNLANGWLRKRFYLANRDWAYSQIEPQLLIEPFIGKCGILPMDFKIFVFQGIARYTKINTGRGINHMSCFYDRDWNKQEFRSQRPLDPADIPQPSSWQDMLEMSEKIAKALRTDFVRVDFYEIDGKLRFGETTFYPDSGFVKFNPIEMDRVFGDFWPIDNS